MQTFVISPSRHSNSLGRGICMALTAGELGDVQLWAIDDGPEWIATPKFGVPVKPFSTDGVGELIAAIAAAAVDDEVVVWISKGLHPLDRIADGASRIPRVTVILDFDEDDLSLITQHVRFSVRNPRSSLRRAAQYPPYHPHSPLRVRRSQARAARAAHAFSFTSNAIHDVYAARGLPDKPSQRIAHTRSFIPRDVVLGRGPADAAPSAPVFAFLGSIRPHKGLSSIVDLVTAMPDARVVSFAQSWRPPVSLRDRWTELPADMSIAQAYEGVDVLLVPQDLQNQVAQTQLSAKVLDAALYGRTIVGSPTKTLEEYCAGAYIPVSDWSEPEEIARRIREADLASLGRQLRDRYEEHFSPKSTSASLGALLARARASQTSI